MIFEFRSDGYERIEAGIQKLEKMAWDGYDAAQPGTKTAMQLQRIAAEAKSLRETLKEVLIINPSEEPEEPPVAA